MKRLCLLRRVTVLVLALALAIAQTVAPLPSFEVSVIRPTTATVPTSQLPQLRHGRMTASNVTLRTLLSAAYGLARNRIFGPDSLDENHFDLIAKSPEGVPDSAFGPLLQSLLRERFRLASHAEERTMPCYDLLEAKGGLRMAAFPAEAKGPKDLNMRGLATITGLYSMPRFAETLSGFAGRPVLDKTSLTDRYNISLKFAMPAWVDRGDAGGLSPPDLFIALREQLGLRLESGKEPLQVLVVDHVDEKPAEN